MHLTHALWASGILASISLSACGGIAVIDGEPDDDDTTTTTTTTTATGRAEIRIDSVIAGANCQPDIPPDPLRVTVMLSVSNDSADFAVIEVVGAVLDSIVGDIRFPLTPASFDVAPQSEIVVELSKAPNTGNGINACELCSANTTMLDLELTLDLDNGGEMQTLTRAVASLGCVF